MCPVWVSPGRKTEDRFSHDVAPLILGGLHGRLWVLGPDPRSAHMWDKQNEPPHGKTNKMTCAPSEDSEQPGHPPSPIRVRMKKAWVLSCPLSAQRKLWSVWTDALADLSLRWTRMSFCWICHEVAQITYSIFRLTKWSARLKITEIHVILTGRKT